MLFLQTTGTEPDAESRGFAEFFNAVHSVEAIIDGVKLAVWCSTRPFRWAIEGAGPVAWFGWLESGNVNTVRVPVAYVDENPDTLASLRYVALATPELEHDAPAAWRTLIDAGYQPRLPRQVTGWYLGAHSRAGQTPSHRPSLALLPEPGVHWNRARCLVLVEVNYAWLVLSERAAPTYEHGARLLEGEAIRFFAENEPHPVKLSLIGRAQPRELDADFGPGLLDAEMGALGIARARDDAASLVVRPEVD